MSNNIPINCRVGSSRIQALQYAWYRVLPKQEVY